MPDSPPSSPSHRTIGVGATTPTPLSDGATTLRSAAADARRAGVRRVNTSRGVMTGRADDASAVYRGASTWHGEQHAVTRIKAADAAALLAAFAVADVAGSDGGTLKARRQAHTAAFAASANPAIVREALRRTLTDHQTADGIRYDSATWLITARPL